MAIVKQSSRPLVRQPRGNAVLCACEWCDGRCRSWLSRELVRGALCSDCVRNCEGGLLRNETFNGERRQ